MGVGLWAGAVLLWGNSSHVHTFAFVYRNTQEIAKACGTLLDVQLPMFTYFFELFLLLVCGD